jgi:hypothetical protein
VDKAREILRAIPAKLAADAAFPQWYASLFRKRWQFAAARVAAQATPINHAVVNSMLADSRLDVIALQLLRRTLGWVPPLERIVILMWLALRMRPYPIFGLVRSALARRWGKG